MTAAAPVAPARLLVVCTGNVCRSPAAHLLLRAGLGAGSGVEVTSAGLAALAGQPVAEPMTRLLAGRGVDATGFAARQLDAGQVRRADVVLTMTAAQRTAVVSRTPAAVRRTFLLRELADLAELSAAELAEGTPARRLAAVVAAAPRARARRPAGAGGDDVEDPYRRPDEVHARALERIADAVGRLLEVLTSERLPVTVGEQGRPSSSAHLPSSGEPGSRMLTLRSDL